jgi:hypothetical protein
MQLSQLVFEAQSTGAAGPCAAVNAREGNSVAAQAAARSNIRLLISHNLALTMGAMADGVDACLNMVNGPPGKVAHAARTRRSFYVAIRVTVCL